MPLLLTGWQVAHGNMAVARVPRESVEARARRLFPLSIFSVNAARRSVSLISPQSGHTHTVRELPNGRLACDCTAGGQGRRCWHIPATAIFLALWEAKNGLWAGEVAV